MIKSLIIGGLAIAFLGWLFTACSGNKTSNVTAAKPRIAVSIPPQMFFVRNIAGDRVDITCLLNSSADPETFEPSVALFRELAEADAFLALGTLPFEKKIVANLTGNSKEPAIYYVNKDIEALRGTHSHHDSHVGHHDENESDNADPHIWSSVKNARIIALNTLDALVAADPKNEDTYRANFARLESRIDSIDSLFIRNVVNNADAPKSFVVWHPSLSYFARDYNLKQLPLSHAGKESSVKGFADRLQKIKDNGTNIFFFQKEFDTDKAHTIARDADIKLIEINPMNEEWEDEIQKLYDAFTINKP